MRTVVMCLESWGKLRILIPRASAFIGLKLECPGSAKGIFLL